MKCDDKNCNLFETQLCRLQNDRAERCLYRRNGHQGEDALDMMRDEFKRIMACPGATIEIKELCERAISDIEQKNQVIVQRDNLAANVHSLRGQILDIGILPCA